MRTEIGLVLLETVQKRKTIKHQTKRTPPVLNCLIKASKYSTDSVVDDRHYLFCDLNSSHSFQGIHGGEVFVLAC